MPGLATCLPFTLAADGLLPHVRLSPGATQDGISRVARDAEDVAWLTATVTDAPENDRANKGLIKLLSESWKLPKSRFAIVSGATRRCKPLRIEGDGTDLAAKVKDWLDEKGT